MNSDGFPALPSHCCSCWSVVLISGMIYLTFLSLVFLEQLQPEWVFMKGMSPAGMCQEASSYGKIINPLFQSTWDPGKQINPGRDSTAVFRVKHWSGIVGWGMAEVGTWNTMQNVITQFHISHYLFIFSCHLFFLFVVSSFFKLLKKLNCLCYIQNSNG